MPKLATDIVEYNLAGFNQSQLAACGLLDTIRRVKGLDRVLQPLVFLFGGGDACGQFERFSPLSGNLPAQSNQGNAGIYHHRKDNQFDQQRRPLEFQKQPHPFFGNKSFRAAYLDIYYTIFLQLKRFFLKNLSKFSKIYVRGTK